jgi:A118 family predicted phage portal protein
MPLPEDKTPWPPKQLSTVLHSMQAWDAWYSGDGDKLALYYGATGPALINQGFDHMAQYKGGLVGRMARWFWGQPVRGLYRTKSHVPIAADLCQAGADLIFAEPPSFTVEGNSATQDRLEDLGDDTLHGVLAEGAEIGGALGGNYLRVAWDRNVVADRPFLTSVHADSALPEFRWGRLTAVTFWRVVAKTDKSVLRHLERHETDANGIGYILHGLYAGDDENLGRAVPLTESPATAPLAPMVDENGAISTESPGLDVVYIPHQRPQRLWRNDPLGSNLGRSMLDGLEQSMDELDEIYTSWMRDIRLGKARVFLARTLLDQLPNGQGAAFDMDQEIFSPLNMLENRAGTGGNLPIQAEQFTIRTAEHQAAAKDKLEVILRTAGFSSQTFGMDDAGRVSNLTATETQARERRSYLTRDRLIRLQRPQLAVIVQKLLAVDAAIFKTEGVTPELPTVAFADSAQESQITLAQTAAALSSAGAASTQTLVQMMHPDWDDTTVQEEVQRIHAEHNAAMPDPSTFTGFGQADPSAEPDPAA